MFGLVVSTETIEHLENPFHFIRELSRVTKPNGVIIITTPNVHSIRSRLKYLFCGLPTLFEYVADDNMGQHISPVSIGQFLYAFSRSDLRLVGIYTTGPKVSLSVSVLLSFLNLVTSFGLRKLRAKRKSYPDYYLNTLSHKQVEELNRDVSLIIVAKKSGY
jgi:SAM-dependent methyltransferase